MLHSSLTRLNLTAGLLCAGFHSADLLDFELHLTSHCRLTLCWVPHCRLPCHRVPHCGSSGTVFYTADLPVAGFHSADLPDIWFYSVVNHTELHTAALPGSSVMVQEGRRQPGDQSMGLTHHQPLTGGGADVETAQDLRQVGLGRRGVGGDAPARPASRAVLTPATRQGKD